MSENILQLLETALKGKYTFQLPEPKKRNDPSGVVTLQELYELEDKILQRLYDKLRSEKDSFGNNYASYL